MKVSNSGKSDVVKKVTKNLYTLNKEQEEQEEQQSSKDNHDTNGHQQSYQEGMERQQQQYEEQQQMEYQQVGDGQQQQQQPSIDSQEQFGKNKSSYKYPNTQQHNKRSHHNIFDHHLLLSLQMQIKQLQQENSLLSNSLATHEQRQQQMITKYSKLQANNKRLTYQLAKVTKTNHQQELQCQNLHQIKATISSQTKLNQQILAQIDKQNLRVITYIKTLLTKLAIAPVNNNNCGEKDHNNSNSKQTECINEYLQKCIATLKQNRKNIHKKYSLQQQQPQSQHKQNLSSNTYTINPNQFHLPFPKYQLQRIPQLLKQNTTLKQQLSKLRQHFNHLSQTYKKTSTQKQFQFKNEQKLLCEKYNSAIHQVKSKYKSLQLKIHQQQSAYRIKLSQFEKVLTQKQKVIKKLKDQLRELNVKLDQIQQERFSLLRSSVHYNNQRETFNNNKKSIKKYIDGECLNETLLASKDHRTQSASGYYEQYDPQLHEESLCEYRPQKKVKHTLIKQEKPQNNFQQSIMKKSHKNKNPIKESNQLSIQKEQQDIQHLNKQIQLLQKQILEQFQYST